MIDWPSLLQEVQWEIDRIVISKNLADQERGWRLCNVAKWINRRINRKLAGYEAVLSELHREPQNYTTKYALMVAKDGENPEDDPTGDAAEWGASKQE
jgi:hypothetical protein